MHADTRLTATTAGMVSQAVKEHDLPRLNRSDLAEMHVMPAGSLH